jgi:hypothetical protein
MLGVLALAGYDTRCETNKTDMDSLPCLARWAGFGDAISDRYFAVFLDIAGDLLACFGWAGKKSDRLHCPYHNLFLWRLIARAG